MTKEEYQKRLAEATKLEVDAYVYFGQGYRFELANVERDPAGLVAVFEYKESISKIYYCIFQKGFNKHEKHVKGSFDEALAQFVLDLKAYYLKVNDRL